MKIGTSWSPPQLQPMRLPARPMPSDHRVHGNVAARGRREPAGDKTVRSSLRNLKGSPLVSLTVFLYTEFWEQGQLIGSCIDKKRAALDREQQIIYTKCINHLDTVAPVRTEKGKRPWRR